MNGTVRCKQPPKAFFVTHGEFDAASNFADELQRRLGTAAYIPQYGDSVTINGTEWNVTTSNIVTTVPEVAALGEYCGSLRVLICSIVLKLSRSLLVTVIKQLVYAKRWKKSENMWMTCCHRCRVFSKGVFEKYELC